MAENNRKNIVKIMRNAAGELAHRIHFLRLPQLIFQSFVLRDITKEAQQQARLALADHIGIFDFKQHRTAVVEYKRPLFPWRQLPAGEIFAVALQQFCPIHFRRVNDGERTVLNLLGIQADQFAERAIDRDNVPALIRQPHAVHGIFPDGTEQRLRTAQRYFRRAPRGNITHVKQHRRLAIVFHANHPDFDRHHPAIRSQTFTFQPRNLTR